MRNFPKQTFAGALLAAFSSAALAQSPSIPPSPTWTRALPAGPDTRVKITEEYARHVAHDSYFWGWPLVNVYNKRLAAAKSTQLAYARSFALRQTRASSPRAFSWTIRPRIEKPFSP